MRSPILIKILILSFTLLPLNLFSDESNLVSPKNFEALHSMFKTQKGESLFWTLPWKIQLDEALKEGAEKGKPIFVWCGAGGAPVGVC